VAAEEWQAYVDAEGRLVFPPEVAARYGLRPGAQVLLEEGTNALRLRRPVTQLAKVYVEPTNRCNLECRTCIRNVWDEPLGQMSATTWAHLLESVGALTPPPTVFFGGLGEPLAHPALVEMVAQVSALGCRVELITNGTLLTADLSHRLITAGLHHLWVSLDGATPESYTDVRLGAALPHVIANLAAFRDARRDAPGPRPHIGIAFVAMRRNLADLPQVIRLGLRLGATHFLVSNVFPYSAELRAEMLYTRALTDIGALPSQWVPQIKLPRLDWDEQTHAIWLEVLRQGRQVIFTGTDPTAVYERCPFIEGGTTSVAWDGSVSPCLPLLHSYRSFFYERERITTRHSLGNVNETPLLALWDSPAYRDLRARVQRFDFSPCIACGGCELAEANQEDCFGDPFPTCGGCLWSRGVIQCP